MLLDASVLSRLLTFALDIGTPVVTVFVMWLAHRLINVFEAKSKMDIPAKTQEMIDDWIQKGLLYAEQKAQNAINSKTTGIMGPAKLEMAANFALDLAQQHGYVDLAKDTVEKLIESKLMTNKVQVVQDNSPKK